jgi:WXG100 family type VII secretion target
MTAPANATNNFDENACNAALADMKTKATAFQDAADLLQREMNSLLNDSWNGDASVAYGAVFAKWHQGYVESRQGLTDLTNQLESAGNYLLDAERNLAASQ